MNKKYTPVIGLETHVELKTKSKMFCSCSADYFGERPNTHVCPVCLGLPGALPVPNKKAIEWCIMIALAVNCKISATSKFDRKNYFYPDLPKGYQISQYDEPFGLEGSIELKDGKKIRIRRVHMEEDTGKLVHEPADQRSKIKDQRSSLIDFNRSGVPLVEIVTEPDFENVGQVVEYLQKLQQIVRYLDVSNADMEKGDMRLEPNVSLKHNTTNTTNKPISNTKLPPYKVEVKNINSYKFVEKAINFEIDRQKKILEEGKTPLQETRGWSEVKRETVSQRSKEQAHDYRYFPEPDIPPIVFTQDKILKIKNQIGELPNEKLSRFKAVFSLPEYDMEILTREKKIADYFEEAVKVGVKHSVSPKQIANYMINKKPDVEKTLPAELVEAILITTQTPQVDQDELKSAVEQALLENPKAVEDYKNGKEEASQFLIGQTMRKIGKKVDSNLIKSAILELLK